MWREASPKGAIADIRTVYQQAGKNRWRIALLAGLTTFGVFSVMVGQSWTKERELPDVTYINSWPLDRTEAETKAFIEENQRLKEERAALEAKVEAETKEFWKALGRASGMDVEAIEANAEAERKAAEAAKGQGAVAN
jgi:uncharacterized protein (UPF0335 family)